MEELTDNKTSNADEKNEALKSIMAFLPPLFQRLESSSSSSYCAFSWPSCVVEALRAVASGPRRSNVDSGHVLSLAISDLRKSLDLQPASLSASASQGLCLFFDELMDRNQADKWFREVLPRMADLLLRLPSLLENHYQNAVVVNGAPACLRLLEPQQPGVVLLSQELIGALLTCAYFCLFPTTNRGAKHLPTINFNQLFACLYDSYDEKQEHKIKCIIHYFERICSSMPVGNVSFERKVLPVGQSSLDISYPAYNFWSKSNTSMCHFEVYNSGLIEDQTNEALEVDFANKYLGGGALHRGCVQEEIRFMINPELIVGMLFLPSMADNESIEVVGAERFSDYSGYASSFRFSGDYVDKKDIDSLARRKTRIIAIDALSVPGKRQYQLDCILREVNKAFCGFFDQHKCPQYQKQFQDDDVLHGLMDQHIKNPSGRSTDNFMSNEDPIDSSGTNKGTSGSERNLDVKIFQCLNGLCQIGIVTGNWGCGAFGGDPELKAIIQWLAASQALRPFLFYYTFGVEALRRLEQVTQWVISHNWTVGDLWSMLVEYASQRLRGETNDGFFYWLLPSLKVDDDPMILDTPPLL